MWYCSQCNSWGPYHTHPVIAWPQPQPVYWPITYQFISNDPKVPYLENRITYLERRVQELEKAAVAKKN